MDRKLLRTLSDESIIKLIVEEKESEAYEIIFSRYSGKVFDKCYSLLKNRTLALEFTEEILAKSYEKLPGFRGQSSFSSWLYTITYNYCIDYLRLKKKINYPKWSSENEIPEIIDDSEELELDYTMENLLLILDEIHPEEKALILMKYQENLSINQISKALRISEDAAKMRLKRARTRIVYLYKSKFSKTR